MTHKPKIFCSIVLSCLPLCIGIAGCTDHVGITLVSTRVVDLKNYDWTGRVLRAENRAIAVRVDFHTDSNLVDDARAYELNVSNRATICADGHVDLSRELQEDDYVYNTAGMISLGEVSQLSDNVYQIYFYTKSLRLAGQPDAFAYDLERKPEDICFHLEGGSMIGTKLASNTIIISKDVLTDTIKRAQIK